VVASLLLDIPPGLDPSPFDPDRFR
jgi:hypothetical protein